MAAARSSGRAIAEQSNSTSNARRHADAAQAPSPLREPRFDGQPGRQHFHEQAATARAPPIAPERPHGRDPHACTSHLAARRHGQRQRDDGRSLSCRSPRSANGRRCRRQGRRRASASRPPHGHRPALQRDRRRATTATPAGPANRESRARWRRTGWSRISAPIASRHASISGECRSHRRTRDSAMQRGTAGSRFGYRGRGRLRRRPGPVPARRSHARAADGSLSAASSGATARWIAASNPKANAAVARTCSSASATRPRPRARLPASRRDQSPVRPGDEPRDRRPPRGASSPRQRLRREAHVAVRVAGSSRPCARSRSRRRLGRRGWRNRCLGRRRAPARHHDRDRNARAAHFSRRIRSSSQ